jgi:two-component system sensor histidine kinase UhpB
MYNHSNNLINILILEHDPYDIELLLHELKKSKLNFRHIVVSTKQEFIQALKDFKPQVVLSDYSLPSFDGLSAYKIIKEQYTGLPFVIVSGTIGEENAVELIKLGVTDYVLKDKLFSVGPKIIRALREANEIKEKQRAEEERSFAEEELRLSEKRYRFLFEKNPLPMWIYNVKSLKFIEVNETALELYGYSKEEFLNMTIFDIRPQEEKQRLKNIHEKGELYKKSIYKTGEWKHLKKNGEIISVDEAVSKMNYEGIDAVLALINDITEKKKLQEILIEEKIKKQKDITRASMYMQEKEREVIGRELHDNVNQILTSAKLYLDFAMEQENPTKALIIKCQERIVNAINEIRNISKALVPPSVDDLGLKHSVHDLASTIGNLQKLFFDLQIDFDEKDLSALLKVTLFRIIQEQVTNIVKYSMATQVLIKITQTNDQVTLIIKDDGVGFDVEEKRKGIGINNIYKRVEALDGEAQIISKRGKGCKISVVIPIVNEMQEVVGAAI